MKLKMESSKTRIKPYIIYINGLYSYHHGADYGITPINDNKKVI